MHDRPSLPHLLLLCGDLGGAGLGQELLGLLKVSVNPPQVRLGATGVLQHGENKTWCEMIASTIVPYSIPRKAAHQRTETTRLIRLSVLHHFDVFSFFYLFSRLLQVVLCLAHRIVGKSHSILCCYSGHLRKVRSFDGVNACLYQYEQKDLATNKSQLTYMINDKSII